MQTLQGNAKKIFGKVLDLIYPGTATFESLLADAEAFYLERFGIDFRNVPLGDDGSKFHDDGILLVPWRVNPGIRYTATTIGNHGRIEQTVQIRDAGFAAIVVADNVLLHGAYGGSAGVPALPNDVFAFGAYSVPGPGRGRGNRQPAIIRYGAFEPMRGNADGNIVIACELLDSPYGPGLAYGIAKFTPLGDNDAHVFVRNVLTFPGQLTSI